MQEKVNSSVSPQGVSFIGPNSETTRSYLNEERSNEPRTTLREVKAREREIVRKGIDWLEMKIKQYINVYVSKDQVDIALLKMCKITDVPSLNSVMGNIQKALQRYVGFDGMNAEYCDRIEALMDRAQAWCQDIEEQ